MAELKWSLCDRLGVQLAALQDRHGSKATIPLNDQRTGSVTLSLEHPAARLVTPLGRTLKGWLDGAPIFNGPILTPVFDGQAGTVEIPAVDSSLYVQLSPFEPPAPATSPYVFNLLATDQSTIMSAVIGGAAPTSAELAAGIPGLPIASGTLPATVLRDRHYEPGQDRWGAVRNLSQVIGGVDFELEPLDRTDGIMARLNTFARQGSDKSATVKFAYNWGADNCENLVWKPDGGLVVNRSIYLGQSEYGGAPPYYRSSQVDSGIAFGILKEVVGRSDVSDPTTLREWAQSRASILAFPPDLCEVTPAVEGLGTVDPATNQRQRVNPQTGSRYGTPPIVGPASDYWLGDSVQVNGQMDAAGLVKVSLRGRVTQIELSDDDASNHETRAALQLAPELPSYLVS